MTKEFIVNAYAYNHMKWMDKYNYTVKSNLYGAYFAFKVNENDKKMLLKQLKRHHIKYNIYDKKWERSSNYREQFFKYNCGPYRCRYCNKKISKSNVIVDHLYPIAAGKYRPNTRILLYMRNISNVNDVKNLVPSCYKCNSKKSDKLGLWYIRGILGKYKIYWIILILLKITIILSLIYVGYLFVSGTISLKNLLDWGIFQFENI
mgnify:CR=1 FL=1